MTPLLPQSKCENAAQATPRTALLTADPSECLRATPVAYTIKSNYQKSKWHRFGIAASKHTHAANRKPFSFHQPQAAPPQHFPQDNFDGCSEVLRSCTFGRGFVQPGNAKNAGELPKISRSSRSRKPPVFCSRVLCIPL